MGGATTDIVVLFRQSPGGDVGGSLRCIETGMRIAGRLLTNNQGGAKTTAIGLTNDTGSPAGESSPVAPSTPKTDTLAPS